MRDKNNLPNNLTRRDLLKYGLYGGLAASVSPVLFPTGCRNKPRTQGPNIIFILIDTLRADRMGIHGYHRDITPTIDAIASEGVIFDRVTAQAPWTQPSVASLFCSRYPSVHKVLNFNLARAMRWGQQQKMEVFDDSFVTLAEALRDNGYETAGFIANYLTSGFYGFAQGFDLFADMPYYKQQHDEPPGKMLNNESLNWLNRRKSKKPFFLYLHYMDVHGPYYARPEFHEPLFEKVRQLPNKHKLSPQQKRSLGYLTTRQAAPIVNKYKELTGYQEWWSAFYDAGVREVDRHISDMKSRLTKMGLWDNAYVIITSDHGEELLEHGFWGHGNSLYHTELHVPLIMRSPGALSPGKRIKGTVRLIDIMPTILDQLHLPEVPGLQGRSLTPDIAGKLPTPTPPFIR